MGASSSTESVSVPVASSEPSQEEFKAAVRASAARFKEMVEENKVMIFSATYCSYCTVAKVGWGRVLRRLERRRKLPTLNIPNNWAVF